MTHYMMDCFYPDKAELDGYRKESFSVTAGGDSSAITEAKALTALYPDAEFFKLRKITKATDRSGGTCLYDSREGD